MVGCLTCSAPNTTQSCERTPTPTPPPSTPPDKTDIPGRALPTVAVPHGLTLDLSEDPFGGVLNGPWALQDSNL